ncbi:hypothetical protein VTO42DRAFT_5505 [Malbranchea cinnamomea]
MQSFIRRGISFFSPSPSSDGEGGIGSTPGLVTPLKFATVSSEDALFPKVDPKVDGEGCDRDCASCTIHYPAKFDVEMSDKLYGQVKGWSTHILVATGKTDWVHDVADEKGSLMEAIEKGGLQPSNGRLKLSASNMPVPDEYHHAEPGEQPTSVLILPAFTIVEHVTPARASDLIKYFINPAPTTTTPLQNSIPAAKQPLQEDIRGREEESQSLDEPQTVDIASLTPLRSRPCPHAAVILLCSQRTRDARCGQSAPLLRREFERHLRALGLYRDLHDERPGGVGIYFISHVGGHKYAANVMIYRRRDFEWFRKRQDQSQGRDSSAVAEDQGEADPADAEGAAQGIWLARVRPEDCEGIVKFTVLQGKVVKPSLQLRGGFDREKGLISW